MRPRFRSTRRRRQRLRGAGSVSSSTRASSSRSCGAPGSGVSRPSGSVGSWLHDFLRIPVGGSAFDAFGWLNRSVAAIGLVILIVGIVLLILSMRLGSAAAEEDYDVGIPRKS